MKLSNKKIGKTKYPEKTSVNLLVSESKEMENPKVQIGIFIIFIILLLVFVKFMVADKLMDAYSAKRDYMNMESQITTYQEKNKDYEAVREEYSHYGNGYLNEEEASEYDRTKMLSLIDSCVIGKADIQGVEISHNVANVTVTNVTLKTVSSIVDSLESRDSVSYVTVTTAGKGHDSNSVVTATMTINYKSAGGNL